MAYDLGTLVTRTQQRIRNTSYPMSEIIGYINDTQNDVFNEYQLPFMQALQTYTVTPGTSDITNGSDLPTNYVQAINLTLTSNGIEQVIPYKEVTLSDIDNPDQDDQPRNYPEYWYHYGETIRLYPAPAGSYTLRLRYYKKPTELTTSDQVPEIPSEFAELLIVGAAYRILQVKDNYDQAGVFQNKYDELLQKLVVKYTQLQTGQVTVMPINVFTRGGNF